MRKLATIRQISNLSPIDGADAIVVAQIDGWKVVVKKDEFIVGDLCVYCEVDSFLPDGTSAWQHLVDKHARMFDGVRGHRLRTVKLRGQVSQGFAFHITDALQGAWKHGNTDIALEGRGLEINDDVSDILSIVKWEAAIPGELAGQVNGNFPVFIPKTNQARCQNIGAAIFIDNKDSRYERTLKLDGTSFTAYNFDNQSGVCSRNWDLTVNGATSNNTYVRMFTTSGLQLALAEIGGNYAVQGELMGPDIQRNREGLHAHAVYVFDIYDIDASEYLAPAKRMECLDELYRLGVSRALITHVPVLGNNDSLEDLGITDTDGLLAHAEQPSIKHPIAEGEVYKRIDGKFSFKAISNRFLLKEQD